MSPSGQSSGSTRGSPCYGCSSRLSVLPPAEARADGAGRGRGPGVVSKQRRELLRGQPERLVRVGGSGRQSDRRDSRRQRVRLDVTKPRKTRRQGSGAVGPKERLWKSERPGRRASERERAKETREKSGRKQTLTATVDGRYPLVHTVRVSRASWSSLTAPTTLGCAPKTLSTSSLFSWSALNPYLGGSPSWSSP